MNTQTIALINEYHDSVTRLLVLWNLRRTFYGEDKRTRFDFRVFSSELGIWNFTETLKILHDLMKEGVIEIRDFDGDADPVKSEKGEWGRILDVSIPKGNDIQELYERELLKFPLKLDHYSLDSQITTLSQYLFEKAQEYGKKEITFGPEDKFDKWGVMNPFYALLCLESDGVLSIQGVEDDYKLFKLEGKKFDFRCYKLRINMASYIIRGDNYTIDLKNNLISFENPEREIVLSPKNAGYRLFEQFARLTKKRLSHEEFMKTVTRGFHAGKGAKGLKEDVKKAVRHIREQALEGAKMGSDFDIIINKGGFITLRGLK